MSVWCVCNLPSFPSAQYRPMTVWCEHSDVITHHTVDQSCMTWIGKKEREEEKKEKRLIHFKESALKVASFTPDTSLRVRKYTFININIVSVLHVVVSFQDCCVVCVTVCCVQEKRTQTLDSEAKPCASYIKTKSKNFIITFYVILSST